MCPLEKEEVAIMSKVTVVKIWMKTGDRGFVTEFNSEQELHRALRGWLAGAKVQKLNPNVRSALRSKGMKSHFQSNTYLAVANGL